MDLDRRTYFPKPCCYHTKYIIIRKYVANITYFQNPSREEVTPNRQIFNKAFLNFHQIFFLGYFLIIFYTLFFNHGFYQNISYKSQYNYQKICCKYLPPGSQAINHIHEQHTDWELPHVNCSWGKKRMLPCDYSRNVISIFENNNS